MLEFLKMFGMGVLYTILSPIILCFFLLFVVYALINYIVCEVIYFGGFFFGKNFSDVTPLEKEYERMKREKALQIQKAKEEAALRESALMARVARDN